MTQMLETSTNDPKYYAKCQYAIQRDISAKLHCGSRESPRVLIRPNWPLKGFIAQYSGLVHPLTKPIWMKSSTYYASPA